MYVVINVTMVTVSRDFGPYGMLFMNVYVVTMAMVMLLRDFGSFGIIFGTVVTQYSVRLQTGQPEFDVR
jgi:hypothetical protein